MNHLPQSDCQQASNKSIIPIKDITLLPRRFRDRFSLQPCTKTGVTGDCWTWNGPLYQGYGRLKYRFNKSEKAHRVIYEFLVGPIPEGLELDHLCYNRACVNPAHLEPVTRLENIRRSHITGSGNGTRTHCRQGHEFTPENIYHWHGKRFCLKCQRLRQSAYEKRKAERAA